MNNLLANTIQQEIDALQAQLTAIEERAAALRATLAQYKEALAAEQQTATEALSAAKQAQETALSALVTAKAAQKQLANIPTVETPYIASPEEDNEVEIELVYEEEEVEVETAVETPLAASLEEENEVEIELVYAEEDVEEESVAEEIPAEEPIAAVEVEKTATTATLLPPIEDIRKAISLGDRFLFQRELFAGNGELMNKTIDKLNALSSLEEAQKYISKHFSWDTESQAYELFTNILKRRWA